MPGGRAAVSRHWRDAAADHLAPYGLRRILLATDDAHEVYAKVGFEPLAQPGKWMALGGQ